VPLSSSCRERTTRNAVPDVFEFLHWQHRAFVVRGFVDLSCHQAGCSISGCLTGRQAGAFLPRFASLLLTGHERASTFLPSLVSPWPRSRCILNRFCHDRICNSRIRVSCPRGAQSELLQSVHLNVRCWCVSIEVVLLWRRLHDGFVLCPRCSWRSGVSHVLKTPLEQLMGRIKES
jgi:hypothetical protein